jgi:hypothetical protein
MEESYIVKTGVGRFRVEKTVKRGYNTNKISGEFLKIGGKNLCVELYWKDSDTTNADLQWINVEQGGCELNGVPIKKEKTQHMFHLAITLLKKYLPDVKTITLLDNSKFKCILPNGKIIQIHTIKYHFLKHGSTYYDLKFGAVPINDSEKIIYEKIKSNYSDPSKKPQSFNFINDALINEFMPIYQSSATWAEFFSKIKSTMESSCEKIAGWYLNAFYYISDKTPMPEYWVIDKFENIDYVRVQNAGTRKMRKYRTRKNRELYNTTDISPTEYSLLKF